MAGTSMLWFFVPEKKENKIILRRSWQVTKKLPVLVVEKDVPKFNTLHTQPNQSTNPLRSMSMGQVA